MLYVTGDTHGDLDFQKILDWVGATKLNKDKDYLIILGDFGYVWENKRDNYEKEKLDFISCLPFTTLFIDGNHENHSRLNAMRVVNFMGGKAHKVYDSIYHLMRGQVYNICNKSIFTFGGASSVDRNLRVEGVSWWKEEEFNYIEAETAYENLNKINWEVEYVLTHSAPFSIKDKLYGNNNLYAPSATERLLEAILRNIRFKQWYFGHYHKDMKLDNFSILYNRVERMKANGGSLF